MAPYEEKGKIIELLSCLANNNIFVFTFLFISALFLAALAWFFLPVYFSLGIIIVIAIGLAVFISYRKDISIPLIEVILKREYYRVKFKHSEKEKRSIFVRAYLKVLYYLILLFKSSEDSFSLLKDDVFIKLGEILDKTKEEKIDDKFKRVKQTMEKIKKGQEVDKPSLAELEEELFKFSKFRQKKITVFSLTAITALIIITVAAGLISSFLFPEVFKTRAASYGFIQTDWSGGSSTATALHPGDQTNWNKYFFKDNVSTSTPGELSLDFETTEIWSQTSDSDWNTHATSSTYYSGGSVGILRPLGAVCTLVEQCGSGYCVDGYCCDTACASACYTCSKSGSEGTCTAITATEGKSCTGICTSCIAGTCTDRSADDTTEGCATNCYDCVAGSCDAVTQNEDGTCAGVCTSCVTGTCTDRSADDTTEGCADNCYDCVSGVCSAVTEEDDGTCSAACTSCVSGNCSNKAIDTSCGSCQYCDGSGTCKTCSWGSGTLKDSTASLAGNQINCACNYTSNGNGRYTTSSTVSGCASTGFWSSYITSGSDSVYLYWCQCN